jgi:hypothetical protein
MPRNRGNRGMPESNAKFREFTERLESLPSGLAEEGGLHGCLNPLARHFRGC